MAFLLSLLMFHEPHTNHSFHSPRYNEREGGIQSQVVKWIESGGGGGERETECVCVCV